MSTNSEDKSTPCVHYASGGLPIPKTKVLLSFNYFGHYASGGPLHYLFLFSFSSTTQMGAWSPSPSLLSILTFWFVLLLSLVLKLQNERTFLNGVWVETTTPKAGNFNCEICVFVRQLV